MGGANSMGGGSKISKTVYGGGSLFGTPEYINTSEFIQHVYLLTAIDTARYVQCNTCTFCHGEKANMPIIKNLFLKIECISFKKAHLGSVSNINTHHIAF